VGSPNVSYPNTYNVEGHLVDLSRLQTGLGDQWGYMLGTWPMTSPGLGPAHVFYHSGMHTWPYFATARSQLDSRTIVFALGYHPISGTFHDVYYGELRGPAFDVWSGGRQLGSLSTGEGLPLTDGDLELVYHAAPGESVRLFNVADNAVVFATFTLPGTGADAVATYHYAGKPCAVCAWRVVDIVSAGAPFHGAGVRNYYGGMAISHSNPYAIVLSRQDAAGDWYIDRWQSVDGGYTFSRISEHACGTMVCARPETEALSEQSYAEREQVALGIAYWYGVYSPTDYTQFATTLETLP